MILGRKELVAVLGQMAALVKAGDSFDGRMVYEYKGDDRFEVDAAYRIGNLQGQGGMRLIRGTPHERKEGQDG